ncbi:MAG: cbb3-type cytochrome oxidase subunit 3 [Azoarcus sp.]|nr:cbb3-type cytochrome oxidase subunit 3 [Azoarcus sp.]
MDINVLRIVVTVVGFLCFVGICVWAYSRHARKRFDEAAMLPFTEDDEDVSAARRDEHTKQGNKNG